MLGQILPLVLRQQLGSVLRDADVLLLQLPQGVLAHPARHVHELLREARELRVGILGTCNTRAGSQSGPRHPMERQQPSTGQTPPTPLYAGDTSLGSHLRPHLCLGRFPHPSQGPLGVGMRLHFYELSTRLPSSQHTRAFRKCRVNRAAGQPVGVSPWGPGTAGPRISGLPQVLARMGAASHASDLPSISLVLNPWVKATEGSWEALNMGGPLTQCPGSHTKQVAQVRMQRQGSGPATVHPWTGLLGWCLETAAQTVGTAMVGEVGAGTEPP